MGSLRQRIYDVKILGSKDNFVIPSLIHFFIQQQAQGIRQQTQI